MAIALRLALVGWMGAVVLAQQPSAAQAPAPPPADAVHAATFQTSHECVACHNGLVTSRGEDVSIGVSWRASMMANSSRDPYWQAAVRREIADHPQAAEDIQQECAICHVPMVAAPARAAGTHLDLFSLLPGRGDSEQHRLAADGVSCTLCHQISAERLGTDASFTGGFVLTPVSPAGEQRMLGPFAVDPGRTSIMRSATGLTPTEATHLAESEVCATCHTLFTTALGPGGVPAGRLAEQVPYLEWRHSAFRTERSCQACHMPVVEQPTRIASVLGEQRDGLNRHTFLGGNFFMLRMLNRYRNELFVEAPAQELEAAAQATLRQLATDTATVTLSRVERSATRLELDVDVRNLTGHKLPTGYPSRRAWLHVVVRNAGGRVVFESGAVNADGSIRGNDNDADAARYEPHHDTIASADQVQIYESVMVDAAGAVTTGLLQGTAYVKDNRLLPRGFDKSTAERDIAVEGAAAADPDFSDKGDRVTYAADLAGVSGSLDVTVELLYQPISFRWARNLGRYDEPEPRRFVGYFDAMAGGSSAVLARATARVP